MPRFSGRSLANLATLHPLLREVAYKAIEQTDFSVICTHRGQADQEKAKAAGNSRAHFGQSPHNYSPALAMDCTPFPCNWNDLDSFRRLAAVMKECAAELNIPIRWGGDWTSLKDFPHFELDPWTSYIDGKAQ